MSTEPWAIGLVLFATVIGSLGPIFLKKASKDMDVSIRSLFNKNFIIGLFFYGIGTVMFIPALKGGELSVLYPLIALIYVWVALLSMKLLNERMNRFKWAAIVLIIGGIILIGVGS